MFHSGMTKIALRPAPRALYVPGGAWGQGRVPSRPFAVGPPVEAVVSAAFGTEVLWHLVTAGLRDETGIEERLAVPLAAGKIEQAIASQVASIAVHTALVLALLVDTGGPGRVVEEHAVSCAEVGPGETLHPDRLGNSLSNRFLQGLA